jgi:hypothetical protein
MKKLYTIMLLIFGLISVDLNAAQIPDIPKNYGEFVANNGQWNSDILSVSEGNGYKLIVKNDGVYFDYYQSNDKTIKGQVVKLAFDKKVNLIEGLDPLITKYNYFIGNDQSKWISNVPLYSKVKLNEILNGVDIVLQMQETNPRYDLYVKPGTNPESIKLNFEGANRLFSTTNGNLALSTNLGDVEIGRLIAYQNSSNGKQTFVECKFVVNNNQVSFKVGNYDKSKTLIIDPTVYSSFDGGKGADVINNIASINSNEFVVAGTTESDDLNTSTGAYSSAYIGSKDGFLAKYSVNFGKFDLVFKTYIGSTGDDNLSDVGVDQLGNIYVCGYTESATFPVKNNFGTDYRAAKEGFIMKFNQTASTLVYSGLVNGKNDEVLSAMVVDGPGDVICVGYTNSNDILKSGGVNGKVYKNAKDVYEIKISSSGTLLHTNIFGGNFDDYATDVAINSSGTMFITGASLSQDYPMDPIGGGGGPVPASHPYDDSHNGAYDAFVTVVDGLGASLLNSTYIGGTGDDIGKSVYGYDDNSFMVSGESKKGANAPFFPTSAGAIQLTSAGGVDIFLSKIEAPKKNTQGPSTYYNQKLLYSTLFGSSADDNVIGMKYDNISNAFLVYGTTTSSSYFVVNDENSKYGGMKDIFLTEFDNSLSTVNFSTLVGGKKDDIPAGISFDNDGNYTLVGTTSSNEWKQTLNARQATFKGGTSDGFIIKNVKGDIGISSPSGEGTFCKGTVMNIGWFQTNLNSKLPTQIELVRKSTGEITPIASNLLDKVYYGWDIPTSLTAANDYLIRISHESGAFDISEIPIELAASPKITEIKAVSNTTLCEAEDLNIQVSAEGKNLTYAWKLNDKVIANQTGSLLALKNVKMTDAGNYTVTVEGLCSPLVVSTPVNITVLKTTKVTTNPVNTEIAEKSIAKFTVAAEGNEVTYQWLKDGGAILNATSRK